MTQQPVKIRFWIEPPRCPVCKSTLVLINRSIKVGECEDCGHLWRPI